MRRLFISFVLIFFLIRPAIAGQPDFKRYFTSSSLRVDLYHTGYKSKELFSIDEVIEEPCWGGNHNALIDTMNLGTYIYRVFDLETNDLVFSRGYCSIFGEWVTTDEAREGKVGTFHESVIMPFPRRPVQIRIDRRNRENIFTNVFSFVVDPDDYNIATESRYDYFRARTLIKNGPPARKVDIVIIGDGYRKNENHKLRNDAERFIEVLFSVEPFKSRRDDFNVRLVESVSGQSGVDNPRESDYRNNLLGLSFDTFSIDRYMLSTDNRRIRDIAAKVPYDQVILLANEEKYGGGGIFNLYSASVSDNEYSEYIFVHEFGHAFAGLADEYYSSEVTYNDMYPRGVEPWEPNVTALLNGDCVKWGDLIGPNVPIPTPDDSTYAGITGCFEGAAYSAEGLYRSSRDCIMFSKSIEKGFCPACGRAIERMIDFRTNQ
ncbi:MAG: M64 family metallopeptidase [Candidatus Krumholzibacteriota bacterium]|nr:M64 family metallopeptidase [Candidatus Krumholzibacteriota bacterium]